MIAAIATIRPLPWLREVAELLAGTALFLAPLAAIWAGVHAL